MDVRKRARAHVVDLEQCALFVDSPPLKKSMIDAALFLRQQYGIEDLKRTVGGPPPRAVTPHQSGEACSTCGNFSLVRSGTCLTCQMCGTTTGCG